MMYPHPYALHIFILNILDILKTSSAIAEIDDGPHGTSTHYIITKPQFFNFQKNFEDRPTDRQSHL